MHGSNIYKHSGMVFLCVHSYFLFSGIHEISLSLLIMNIYLISDEERRALCKQILESLEFWLRRIIHDTFQEKFDQNYIDAKKQNNDFLINRAIRKKINER